VFRRFGGTSTAKKRKDDQQLVPEDDQQLVPEDDQQQVPEDDQQLVPEDDQQLVPEAGVWVAVLILRNVYNSAVDFQQRNSY
jgi:hypothetical protein